jgi:hypothetical protein
LKDRSISVGAASWENDAHGMSNLGRHSNELC